ncbi:uncharacterized protein AMSG_06743 [Thecamonas trahens ATCC 50062]|uniref:Uncharacterized protein n=1 Tax=Thecamonas trahens ATCC 50062 TaxID=461836 RepID=A0A0L0DF40_THETB|nr:hypothetical protein AMSG_06743 [Thecamonas trahens ATCC 50062]KNC50840.1 hypothetical protein AMSG_06743 [Thecamonas trahens ATCC 50062]|eukprot:XP_013756795.1 hypothetical protein AMSG_06743 [Thecamonas trahens ATCC 50062]
MASTVATDESSETVAGWHRKAAVAAGAVCWFWIMYRAKQDLPVMLGMRHPWEGHGHGDGHGDDHAHGEH